MSEKPTKVPHRGYMIAVAVDDEGMWAYQYEGGNRAGWGCSEFDFRKDALNAGKRAIDDLYTGSMITDKPTTQDLLLLEVRDLVASVGELRISLDAMWRQVVRLQEQINELEAMEARLREVEKICLRCGTPDTTWTGTIQGLEGVFTVTPPPEFEA